MDGAWQVVRSAAFALAGALVLVALVHSTHLLDPARTRLADRRWPAGSVDDRVLPASPDARVVAGFANPDLRILATSGASPLPEEDDRWVDGSLTLAEQVSRSGASAVVFVDPHPRLWSSPRLEALARDGACVVVAVTDGTGRSVAGTTLSGPLPVVVDGVVAAHGVLRFDGTVARAIPALLNPGGDLAPATTSPQTAEADGLPALAVAAASCLERRPPRSDGGRLRIGNLDVGLQSNLEYVVPFAGGEVASGAPPQQLSRTSVRGAVVLIGRDRGEQIGSLETPVGDGLSPVLFHAQALNGLLAQRTVTTQSPGSSLVVSLLLGAIVAWAVLRWATVVAIAVSSLAVSAWWFSASRLAPIDHRPDLVTPLLVSIAAGFVALIIRWRRDEVKARRLIDVLTQYVPSDVARRLLDRAAVGGLPTGTITFVLTDIVDSTQAWEQAPDSMLEAIKQHDDLITAVFERHGGWLVRPRGEGDSRFGVFADPVDAALAVIELQRCLGEVRWRTPFPLRVRTGLHTGEADLYEGDFYGSPVNRCARIRSSADAGRALVSDATARLVRDRLPLEIELVDRGVRVLRGIAEPEHIWELRCAPGAPAGLSTPSL